MSKIIRVAMLALAMALVVPTTVHAVTGDKGYFYGSENPEDLAQHIDATLAKDPSGAMLLDAEKCHLDGSCASPQYYFQAINQNLANAGFKKRLSSVSEVPGYIRTLKVVHNPSGRYEVSCLRPVGNDKFKVVMDCLEREFKPDEDAWVDSETRGDYKVDLVVITSDCANVVSKKIILKITIIGGTPETTIAPPFATKGCPDGFTVFFHVWSCEALPTQLCERAQTLIQLAEVRDGKKGTNLNAYKPSAVSRTLYEPLSYKPEAKVNESITVQFLDSQTLRVEGETQNVAIIAGIGKMKVTEAQLDLVRKSTWPSNHISPVASCGSSDEQCIISFPYEWKNKKGGRYCAVHEVGLLK